MTGFHGSRVGLFQVLLSFTSPQRQIALYAYVSIGERPALPSLIDEDHPQQVVLLRVVDQYVRPTSSFGGVHGNWWVELEHYA